MKPIAKNVKSDATSLMSTLISDSSVIVLPAAHCGFLAYHMWISLLESPTSNMISFLKHINSHRAQYVYVDDRVIDIIVITRSSIAFCTVNFSGLDRRTLPVCWAAVPIYRISLFRWTRRLSANTWSPGRWKMQNGLFWSSWSRPWPGNTQTWIWFYCRWFFSSTRSFPRFPKRAHANTIDNHGPTRFTILRTLKNTW